MKAKTITVPPSNLIVVIIITAIKIVFLCRQSLVHRVSMLQTVNFAQCHLHYMLIKYSYASEMLLQYRLTVTAVGIDSDLLHCKQPFCACVGNRAAFDLCACDLTALYTCIASRKLTSWILGTDLRCRSDLQTRRT
jgi:hypothetical protein